MRRDIEDDLRFLAWESLKGSVRFKAAMEALKSVAERYGSSNVCIAGHSLGGGFALQSGKSISERRDVCGNSFVQFAFCFASNELQKYQRESRICLEEI